MLLRKSLLTILLAAGIVSCCTVNSTNNNTQPGFSQEEKTLARTRESIVKISTLTEITLIDKITKMPTTTERNIHSGSGSIIGQTTTGTMILTAAHVCDMPLKNEKDILFFFPWYKKEIYDIKTTNTNVVIDINDIKYEARQIVSAPPYDTCILITTKIPHPALQLSKAPVQHAQKSYLFGFPMGIWEADYVPIFEGFYAGLLTSGDGINRASYSIPTYPGVSGGPIIDLDGKIIGMIHSYMQQFNNLCLAATLKQIEETLEMSNSLYHADKVSYDLIMLQLMVSVTTSTATQ